MAFGWRRADEVPVPSLSPPMDVSDALETCGFALNPSPFDANVDSDSDEERKAIMRMIQDITGADKVAMASRVERAIMSDGEFSCETETGQRGGAFFVHGDFSDEFKDQLQCMYDNSNNASPDKLKSLAAEPIRNGGLGLDHDTFQNGRLAVVNVWWSVSPLPVRRAPLAVCDARTLRQSDLAVYAYMPDPPPDNYQLPLPNLLTVAAYNPTQMWYYFPQMTPGECLLVKTYDSALAQPQNGVGVHSAFENLQDPLAQSEGRHSVEMRIMCFFNQ